MSFTIRTTTAGELELVSTSQSAERQIPAHTDETHYHVVLAFVPKLDTNARVEILGLVSAPGVILRAWFFDLAGAALLTGSQVSLAETAEATRKGQAVPLTAGKTYQILVSAEAAAIGPGAFGIVRSVTPVE